MDENKDELPDIPVMGGISQSVPIAYKRAFRYLDIDGNSLDNVEKKLELPEYLEAPVREKDEVGTVKYLLNGKEIGSVPILAMETVEQARFKDYFKRAVGYFLL